jgi:UDP-3-O-[3-hydroxymyristoyl] glucosamine N-acyltransferase
MTDLTVAALAALVGGRLLGDGERIIRGIGDLRTAGQDRIGFVRHPRYAALAATTQAGAVLLAEPLATSASQIVVGDVDVAYAKVANHFHPQPLATAHAVHPTAVVHPEAMLEAPVQIGPHAVVGKSRIGAGTVLQAGVVVGDGVVMGRGCVLYPHATVYCGARLGDRVVLHAQAVVGSDGFGYAREGTTWIKVPQLGGVVLENDVELGAGTAVDRGTIGDTRIGARSKLDNHCHVAHNCNIGCDVVMAAGVRIAGSTAVGDRCVFAGNVGIGGHLQIAADVRLGGQSVVLRDVREPGDYMGDPLMEKKKWMRHQHAMQEFLEIRTDFVLRQRAAEQAPGVDP